MSPQNSHAVWAIVPASGIGSRMQSELPKQYLPLLGQTIIDITLRKLLQLECIAGVVVATNKDDCHWKKTSVHSHPKIHRVVGGKERADSVKNALEYCVSKNSSSDVYALVHDAARPCVTPSNIQALIDDVIACRADDSADGGILAVPCADTVKRVQGHNIQGTEDRSTLWLAHTPQMFLAKTLLQALTKAEASGHMVTDEASAIEYSGGRVTVVKDRRDNIKVTVPEDLHWAETILRQQGV